MAAAISIVLLASWESVSLPSTSVNGDAFSLSDWTSALSVLPSTAFMFDTWARYEATSTDSYLVKITSGSNHAGLMWGATDSPVLDGSGTPAPLTTLPHTRPNGTWFHISLAMLNDGNLRGTFTLRTATSPYQQSVYISSSPFQLTSSSVLVAPFVSSTVFSGHYTDAKIVVGYYETDTVMMEAAAGTFLCGSATLPCVDCHPSCDGCDANDNCSSCWHARGIPFAANAACRCPNGYGGSDAYQGSCAACDSACNICWLAADPTSCLPCATGCSFCFGIEPEACLKSQEQVDYVKTALFDVNLPLEKENSDHLLCFRQPRDLSGCTPDAIEDVTGTIENYSTGSNAVPALSQCYQLLEAEWPFLKSYFATIFSGYTGPSSVTDAERMKIKTILYTWILQFGPATMQDADWDELRAALVTSDWTTYLGWIQTTEPGFVVSGSTRKVYPDALLAWLKSTNGCNTVAAGCVDLDVFNLASTFCDTSCSLGAQCQEVKPGSTCT